MHTLSYLRSVLEEIQRQILGWEMDLETIFHFNDVELSCLCMFNNLSHKLEIWVFFIF